MESQVYLLSAHVITIMNVMADTFRVLFKEKEGHSSTLPSMKVQKKDPHLHFSYHMRISVHQINISD